MLDPDMRRRLLDRLGESRRGLLDALEGVTERDFGTRVDGEGGPTVAELLAAVAQAERNAVALARGERAAEGAAGRPLPPQVIHDLAGARYQVRRYLESAQADPAAAGSLVSGIEEREADAAKRIRLRPRPDPPPVIPFIQP